MRRSSCSNAGVVSLISRHEVWPAEARKGMTFPGRIKDRAHEP